MGTLFSCLSQIAEAARIPWLASIFQANKGLPGLFRNACSFRI